MTRNELDQIKDLVEASYHYAGRQYDLPYPNTAMYNAKGGPDAYWSCPMHPDEIANRLENTFGATVTEEEFS